MKRKNIKKYIILIILLLIVFVFVPDIIKYNKAKSFNKLIEITQSHYKEFVKEEKRYLGEDNDDTTYIDVETVIVAGDENEFVSEVYYYVDVELEDESFSTVCLYEVRLKIDNNSNYSIVSEGEEVNSLGLEEVNYSSNEKKNNELIKIKEDILINESKKSAGIYMQLYKDKLRLSYDRQKTWIDTPIPHEFIGSNLQGLTLKLEEGTAQINHKKTAFISTNGYDVLVNISNDKGKTWNEIEIQDGYEDYSNLLIGFSTLDLGYFAINKYEGDVTSYSTKIYLSTDGGENFNEINISNEIFTKEICSLGFLNENIGLIAMSNDNQDNPILYRTDDKGNSWEEVDIRLPYKYAGEKGTPLTPMFYEGNIMLPVRLDGTDDNIYYISTDEGITWDYVDEVENKKEIVVK